MAFGGRDPIRGKTIINKKTTELTITTYLLAYLLTPLSRTLLENVLDLFITVNTTDNWL
jgi:hypothetical protein